MGRMYTIDDYFPCWLCGIWENELDGIRKYLSWIVFTSSLCSLLIYPRSLPTCCRVCIFLCIFVRFAAWYCRIFCRPFSPHANLSPVSHILLSTDRLGFCNQISCITTTITTATTTTTITTTVLPKAWLYDVFFDYTYHHVKRIAHGLREKAGEKKEVFHIDNLFTAILFLSLFVIVFVGWPRAWTWRPVQTNQFWHDRGTCFHAVHGCLSEVQPAIPYCCSVAGIPVCIICIPVCLDEKFRPLGAWII